jgi:hypothetical protein
MAAMLSAEKQCLRYYHIAAHCVRSDTHFPRARACNMANGYVNVHVAVSYGIFLRCGALSGLFWNKGNPEHKMLATGRVR